MIKQLLKLNGNGNTHSESATAQKSSKSKKQNSIGKKSNQRQQQKSSLKPKSTSNSHLNSEELVNSPSQKSPKNVKNDQEHFNFLIEKLMPSLKTHLVEQSKPESQTNANSDDILKWFRSPQSNQSL